jgi:CRP-like cAMP-binding protein
LQREAFTNNELIFSELTIGQKLYFIEDGSVIIIHKRTRTKIKELGKESFFGEVAFFSGTPRSATVKCKEFVETMSLDKEDFDKWLKDDPEATALYN